MKYLKIKVTKEIVGGQTTYTYPNWYDAKKVNILMYETSFGKGKVNSEGRGNNDEFIHCVVEDIYGETINTEVDVEDMLRADFIADADVIYETTEKITSPDKVMSILGKQARGETLTQEDNDALDPQNKDVAGIVISQTFGEKVTDVDNG